MSKVAERIVWAIDLLDPQPDDRVLEIGGGAGVAATVVLQRLHSGTFTGLDRSPAMTAQATKRNRQAVEAGTATFVTGDVSDADFSGGRFDRILLVNVNLHLHKPDRDFARIRAWLAPGGRFVAVSHPPVERKALDYEAQMPPMLRAAGFDKIEVMTNRLAGGLATAVVAG